MPVSALAVLGMLSQSPASGYQLAQPVEGAISNFWPTSKSNVYAELAHLEELGLVEATEVAQVKLPNKRVFSLTPAGAAALDAWLQVPTFQKERRKNSLLVKLLFADRLTGDQVAALIDAARQQAESEQARLGAIVDMLDRFPQRPTGPARPPCSDSAMPTPRSPGPARGRSFEPHGDNLDHPSWDLCAAPHRHCRARRSADHRGGVTGGG